MWRNLQKFGQLPGAERALLLEACLVLGRARLMLAVRPFRRIADHLGQSGQETPAVIPPQQQQLAARIGLAVERAARHTPWESRCLAQALAAWLMLRRRGIAGTVYFGVAPNPDQPFDAHAWLRCGSCIVTGAEGHENYRVISCFSRQMP